MAHQNPVHLKTGPRYRAEAVLLPARNEKEVSAANDLTVEAPLPVHNIMKSGIIRKRTVDIILFGKGNLYSNRVYPKVPLTFDRVNEINNVLITFSRLRKIDIKLIGILQILCFPVLGSVFCP